MYKFSLSLIFSFLISCLHALDDAQAEGKLERFREIVREYETSIEQDPKNTRLAIALGDAYYSLKDYPSAIKMYHLALEVLPEDNSIKLSLANAYLADSNKYESRILYQQVLDAEPQNIGALAGLGRIEALEYHFLKAEEYYHRGLQIDPDNTNLQYYLADLQIDLKNYSEAQKTLEKLKQENPKYTWIDKALQRAKDGLLLDAIYKFEEKGDYKEAIARYKEAVENHQGNIEFYLSLARAYILSKQVPEAIVILNQAMNIDPTSRALSMAFGEAYMAGGNFLEAQNYFNKALKKDADDARVLSSLGKLYFLLGDYETAERYYKLAVQSNPASTMAMSSYALYLLSQHQEAKALYLYEKIIANDPKALWAKQAIQDIQFDTSLELLKKEPSQELEGQLLRWIDEFPLQTPYYIKLGRYYMNQKHYQNAANLYLKGLLGDPHSIDLILALGNAYIATGMLDAAKIQFEEALKASANHPEALAGLGKLAEIEKRREDAQKLYQRALANDPKNLTALNYLANLLIVEEKFNETREILEKIKKEDASAQWVDKALTDVKNGPLLAEIKKSIEKKEILKAELLYEQLLLTEPKNSDYYIKAGLFYYHERKYEKAIKTYMRGIRIDPDNADLYASLGYSYLQKDKIDDANKAFKHALKLNAKSPEALSGMGNIWIRKKNFKKAERYLSSALAIAADNDAVLSSLGNLRMQQKNYLEAAEIYSRLMKVIPHERWIRQLYENAVNGSQIDEIHQLVKEEKYREAAAIYAALLEKYPENSLYASGLGLMYLHLKDYERAQEVYLKGLQQAPEDNDLLVSLGYSYLLAKNWSDAYSALSQAVKVDPYNAEALAGLGRIIAEDDCRDTAELYYLKALEIQPTNISALNFYGILLLKEKRFHEAEQVVRQLEFELPNAIWVKHMLKDAEDGPIMEIAREFANEEAFENAAVLYSQLIDSSPLDPARYELLGSMYINLYEYWCGIAIYEQGLAIDPEAFYLWRSIAIAYIYLEEYEAAYCLLSSILEEHPDDAEALAALGKLESLVGTWECAEMYFLEAITLAPENRTVLSFYADFLKMQGYYCSSLAYYNLLLQDEDRPKWIQTGFQDLLNKTMPTITLLAGNHEEKQWDSSVHRNSAKYTVNGFGALVNYPICDGTSLIGKMYDEYFQLRDLLTTRILYSFDVERAYIGSKMLYSSHWIIDWQLGVSNYSRYRKGTTKATQGSLFEPGVRFVYREAQREASLAFWSDSTLIARNFSRNVSKLVGRYYLNTTYQQQVCKRTIAGIDFNASIYNDYVDNTSATALGWVQWRPPIYTDNILFRYHLKYGKFAENIPDYYTYKDQWVNYFQITFENYWRVCWADSLYTSLSLGYGLQNTLTRFAQFIVLAPNPTNKLRWDNRQFSLLNMKGVYKLDQLQVSLILDYYRDTEKYQMSSILFELTWRF